MTSNLWNVQSPTKRIDLCFKIDDYKRHLLRLKNVKSTIKKSSSSSGFIKITDYELISLSKVKNNLSKESQIMRQKQEKTCTARTQCNDQDSHQQVNFQIQKTSPQPWYFIKLNSGLTSPIQQSPNKYQKTRKREINEQNKIIVRKLESVRPSPQLSMKNLSLRYSTVDLKYKMNLQRSKYKHVDFNKQAGRLLNGEKIKFSRMKMSTISKENSIHKDDGSGFVVGLDWRLQREKILQQNDRDSSRTSPVPYIK